MLNGDAGAAELLSEPVKPKPGEPVLLSHLVLAFSESEFAPLPAEKLKFPNGEDADGDAAALISSGSWYFADPAALAPPTDVVSKASASADATSAEARAAAAMTR